MNSLNAADMLTVWEQGLVRPLSQRSLLLLTAACPEMSADAIAALSIGARDAGLLSLRARLFGQRLVNNAACPHCAGRIEWEQNVADLLVGSNCTAVEQTFCLEAEHYRLNFRLPNSLDMAAIETAEPASALRLLLQRCTLTAEYGGTPYAIEQLPETVIQALNDRIEALDPQAEIRIQLTCPDCGQVWDVLFDIESFLWREIEAWAEKLLQTVHKLAKAYGWTERDILALSPLRRQLYLGMVGA